MEESDLIPLALWTCSIVGTLFVIYSFAIFIKNNIENAIRFTLSFLFLLTGFLFFSSVGSIITGQVIRFTIVSLIIAVILAIIGMLLVYILYKPQKADVEDAITKKDKKNLKKQS